METAKNLTREAGLVEASPDARAEPRQHLVIFEDSRQERRFLKTLPPGELFRPGWLAKSKRFRAFLVSAEHEHRHSFSRVCETLDHQHLFALYFELRFRVSVAQELVESQDRDPLRQIEELAARRTTARVSRLPWEVIWEGDTDFEAAIREPMADDFGVRRPLMEILDTFARSYGLEVLGLEVQRVLPETAQAPNGRILKTDRELAKKEDQLWLREQKEQCLGPGLDFGLPAEVTEEASPVSGWLRRTPHLKTYPPGPVAPGVEVAVNVWADTSDFGAGESGAGIEIETAAEEVRVQVWLVPSDHFEIVGLATRTLFLRRAEPRAMCFASSRSGAPPRRPRLGNPPSRE